MTQEKRTKEKKKEKRKRDKQRWMDRGRRENERRSKVIESRTSRLFVLMEIKNERTVGKVKGKGKSKQIKLVAKRMLMLCIAIRRKKHYKNRKTSN